MRKIIPIIAIVFLVCPLLAQAALWGSSFCKEGALNNYPETQKVCVIMESISDILFVAGIVLAVIMVILGGIKYTIAGDDAEKTKSGRKTIINGLIGAAIIFAVGFLIGVVKEFIVDKLIGGG